ncbi:hypothetical protein LNO75_01785 [Mycoplasma sp. T363T]|uniref:ATP-binding protein n=1 Tax=Mycoplasma bradburyae TaxID=2963128 RepID=UPI0023422CC9|nr:hypothetical protein [Mycoplasma bradburyae]MDC4163310.1 hypothetical protein [Mycoplasma bradburyae]
MIEQKYIKQLVLSNSSITQTLEFDKGVNVIIGTKGGGKSTLLKILYALHNNVATYDKEINEITNQFGFSIKKLVYSNGDTIEWSRVRNKEKDTVKRGDFVKQDDDIKTQFDIIQKFKKEKNKFLSNTSEIVANNLKPFFEKYIEGIDEIDDDLSKLNNFAFGDIFKLNNAKNRVILEQLQDFLKVSTNQELLKNNEVAAKKHDELLSILDKFNNELNQNIKYFDSDFFIDQEGYETIVKALDIIRAIHYKNIQSKKFDNIKYIASQKAYEHYQKLLSESEDITNRIASAPKLLDDYFEKIGKSIATNFAFFDGFKRENFYAIPIKNKTISESDPDIEFGIDLKFNIHETNQNDVFLYDFLSKFLYKPSGRDSTDKAEWVSYNIGKNIKKSIDKISDQLKENFTKNLSDNITVLLNGKDYKKLSLGTRSSYGVSRVIRNCTSSILFLDQPEDNVDSYTITKTLIPELNNNKNINQIFVVTHNANTGVLTNPSTTTVCSFTNNDLANSYRQTSFRDKIKIIENEIINTNPSIHYLEGGNKALNDRYEKLIKNIKEDSQNE